MFSIIFEFFNFKKHPIHLWLLFSVFPFIVILIVVLLEEGLSLDLNLSKDITAYLFFTIMPFNIIGIGMFIYSCFKKYPSFFRQFTFHKVMFYFFSTAAVVNFIWMLWVQIDTFQCKKFLCEIILIFPFASIVITMSLLFIYSLILFSKIRKHELIDPNPYL